MTTIRRCLYSEGSANWRLPKSNRYRKYFFHDLIEQVWVFLYAEPARVGPQLRPLWAELRAALFSSRSFILQDQGCPRMAQSRASPSMFLNLFSRTQNDFLFRVFLLVSSFHIGLLRTQQISAHLIVVWTSYLCVRNEQRKRQQRLLWRWMGWETATWLLPFQIPDSSPFHFSCSIRKDGFCPPSSHHK